MEITKPPEGSILLPSLQSIDYPFKVKARLWGGAKWAWLKRVAARRNITTVSGFVFGGISLIATLIILYVPIYFKLRDLDEQIMVISMGVAYGYQFMFGIVRSRRVDKAAKKHDQDRKLRERVIIKNIHERLKNGQTLAGDRATLEAILAAMVSKVAEKVGGYTEERKLDANVMIQPADRPGYFCVIACYESTREVPKYYSFAERWFCRVVWEGTPPHAATAGDIKILHPESYQDVPYRDILSIPIEDLDGKVIACVNIDSQDPHHFPKSSAQLRDISVEVSPYIALLRLTLML